MASVHVQNFGTFCITEIGMVSWCALVRFNKCLDKSKSPTWTASLANPTRRKESSDLGKCRFCKRW